MRVVVVTSCTGTKEANPERALTLEDFRQGREHVAQRERELSVFLMRAADLYRGQQHVRLMRGIRAARDTSLKSMAALSVELWILSAGYGLVSEDEIIAPYRCTFQEMTANALRQWSTTRGIGLQFRRVLAQPYDLAIVLLGGLYLKACALDGSVKLGGLTLLFCGARTASMLPTLAHLRSVVLTNKNTRDFRCGQVGLKGEIAARLLTRLSADNNMIRSLHDRALDFLPLLALPEAKSS